MDNLINDLLGIGGEDALTTNKDLLEAASVDGKTPSAIVQPATAEEASAFLKYADSHGLKVSIRGGGVHYTLPPTSRVALSRIELQRAEWLRTSREASSATSASPSIGESVTRSA